jgi:hypothetical protein
MQDLYEVLRKPNALRRFGITLLHQHFELAHDVGRPRDFHEDTRSLG